MSLYSVKQNHLAVSKEKKTVSILVYEGQELIPVSRGMLAKSHIYQDR